VQFRVSPNKTPIPWAIVYPPNASERLDELIDTYYDVAQKSGMNISNNPSTISSKGIRTIDYETAADAISKATPGFILVILPDDNKER
jgi:hypothetical protein